MRLSAALILAALLAGCAAPNPPISRMNPHSGVFTHASPILSLERRPGMQLDARTVVMEKNGETRWLVLTSVVRDDLNYPEIFRAWSFGHHLDYRRLVHRRIGCVYGCLREELGAIWMTRSEFARLAASDGLTIHLQGKNARYTGTVPASAFAEVLAFEN